MASLVCHELLSPGALEARAYQLDAVDHCLSGSTLLVLPTAMGKTPIEVMVIAERLRTHPGLAILLAPTTALVNQHLSDLREMLVLPSGAESIVSMTGAIAPAKREGMWDSAAVVVATPEVVRNDIQRAAINLEKVSIIVFDEAHHASGNHAMAQVGDHYSEQCEDGLVLAATASPGHRDTEIAEVFDRLALQRIHARPAKDALLAPYAAGLEVNDVLVEVPEELQVLARPLEEWLNHLVDKLRRQGFYTRQGHITTGGFQESRERINKAIARGENIAYRAAKDNAIGMRLCNLHAYLLCQGVAASREYLTRLESSEGAEASSGREFLADTRVRNLHESLNEMTECHSKVTMVRRMVRMRFRQYPESRVIIFANFRDTVEEIAKTLAEIEGSRPLRFVGQASRDGSTGMSQKQQLAGLDSFRSGETNVLVATSVGEEGLDVPKADLVIFYEPVGSEIRTIQRRGRTGRHREGTVHVLVARGTRDEGARAAAKYREDRMHQSIQTVRRRKAAGSVQADGENLDAFHVEIDGEVESCKHWVESERERLSPMLSDPVSTSQSQPSEPTDAGDTQQVVGSNMSEGEIAQRLRPRGQVGLDSFPAMSEDVRLIDPEHLQSSQEEQNAGEEEMVMIAAESLVQGLTEQPSADSTVIRIDHREGGSAIAARLKQAGMTIEIDTLPVGDFQIGGILIERKTARDFVDSLLDGRLLTQAARLAAAAPRAMMLVEGRDMFHHRSVHANALMGALASITLDYGLPVVSCADSRETANFLAVAARREEAMLADLNRTARARMKAASRPNTPEAQWQAKQHPDRFADEEEREAADAASAITSPDFEQPILDATQQTMAAPLATSRQREAERDTRAMLQNVTGIGPTLANRIIEEYGSIAELLSATPEQLTEVRGLSPATAARLLDAIHGRAEKTND